MTAAVKPEFMTKLCPLMSIGHLTANEKPLIAAVGGAPMEPAGTVIGCQGPNCALFVETTGPDGKIDGGGCSLKLSTVAIANLGNVLAAFLTKYNLKAKGS